MTINEYCENLPPLKISKLIELIKIDGYIKYESIIINCMEHKNKIIIDHEADFKPNF